MAEATLPLHLPHIDHTDRVQRQPCTTAVQKPQQQHSNAKRRLDCVVQPHRRRQHQKEVVRAMDQYWHEQRQQAIAAFAEELAVSQVDADDEAGATVQRDRQVHAQQGHLQASHDCVLDVLGGGKARAGCETIDHQAAAIDHPIFEEDAPDSAILEQLLEKARTEVGREEGVGDRLHTEGEAYGDILRLLCPYSALLLPGDVELAVAQVDEGVREPLPAGRRHNIRALADGGDVDPAAYDDVLQGLLQLRAHGLHATVRGAVLGEHSPSPKRCVHALVDDGGHDGAIPAHPSASGPIAGAAMLVRGVAPVRRRALSACRRPGGERDELLRPRARWQTARHLLQL
mmetsp:Transcript_61575/g.177222  ORF Transcript_61575/g.177222 Transcript_61575/m.177222 type:complete len:344 (-) Transcript_61575:533-1564(-)